jgi:hypothetical protein
MIRVICRKLPISVFYDWLVRHLARLWNESSFISDSRWNLPINTPAKIIIWLLKINITQSLGLLIFFLTL